jgi:hypothetical protein
MVSQRHLKNIPRIQTDTGLHDNINRETKQEKTNLNNEEITRETPPT